MKVIFLDLDGVINSHAFYPIDPYCVNILKEIINQTKAKIVITSANKYPFQKKRTTYEQSSLYQNYILPLEQFQISIFDYTPNINSNRYQEITHHLKNHPNITEFVILEDEIFFPKLNGHQIFIDYGYGLTEEDIIPTIQILNGNLIHYQIELLETDYQQRAIISQKRYLKTLSPKKRITL